MAATKDQFVGLRISSESLAWIDNLAEKDGGNRSATIRTLLREAIVARIEAEKATQPQRAR